MLCKLFEEIYSIKSNNVDTILCRRVVKRVDDKGKHIRSIIPTRDNPPPEMSSWLLQFQVRRWRESFIF